MLQIYPLKFSSVQFNSLTYKVVGGTWGTIQRDPLPDFSKGGHRHGQGCQLCPSSVSVQSALKDGLREAVVARDMPQIMSFCLLTAARRGRWRPIRKVRESKWRCKSNQVIQGNQPAYGAVITFPTSCKCSSTWSSSKQASKQTMIC